MERLRPLLAQLPHVLMLVAVLFLALVAGGASVFFQVGLGPWLTAAFTGGQAWREKARARQVEPDSPAEGYVPGKSGQVTFHRRDAPPGYTLLTFCTTQEALLLTMRGEVAHRWALPFSQVWPRPAHIEERIAEWRIHWQKGLVFPNGDLLVVYQAYGDTPYGYGLAKMDRDSKLIWQAPIRAHHDLDLDEDGNIYTLTQRFEREALPGLDVRPPLLVDAVVVLGPDGQVRRKVELVEALLRSPYAPLLRDHGAYEIAGDIIHVNAARVLRRGVTYRIPGARPGQVLFSSRETDMLGIVDMERGEIVWASKGPWRRQHDAHFLENGNIFLFDNHGAYSGPDAAATEHRASRALEYDPGTGKVVWSYDGIDGEYFFSWLRGRAQRLPGAQALITVADAGIVRHVDREKQMLWEWRSQSLAYRLVTSALRYQAEQLPFLRPTHAPAPAP